MKKIKFSKKYPKVWEQKTAQLIYVTRLDHPIGLHKDLIEYDTLAMDGTYYQLPDSELIQLVFLGDKGIPFCTIRRYTPEKHKYYLKAVEEDFEILILE